MHLGCVKKSGQFSELARLIAQLFRLKDKAIQGDPWPRLSLDGEIRRIILFYV